MNIFALNLGIGSLLGGRIKDQIKPKVTPVLEEIKAMATGKPGGK